MFKDYTEIFGGRKAELTLLDSWLQDPAKPFGFIHAPAGLGKTALLIHWILHLQSQQICEVVFHLISSPYQTDTEQVTLRNLVGQLASLYQEEPPFSNIALHSSFHL